MGELAAERAQLTPRLDVPRRGLEELLRGWTSDGQVFAALSAVAGADTEVEWSARDVERRAERVLLEILTDRILSLPDSAAAWLRHLPMTVTSAREVSGRPLRPMDWSTTARRYGWPPRAFVGHPRERIRDETALQTLAWTAQRLARIVADVRPLARQLVGRVERRVDALVEVVRQELGDVEIVRPDRLDIRALATSGVPWSNLAAVAAGLVQAETDLEFLAFQIIEPVPDLEWRLFHLSVLGEVLAALRGLGGRVRWIAPLSASEAPGPQFQVTIGPNRWDLWFEASAAPRYYRATSPYRQATAAVGSAQQPIGADILLCLPQARALALECKWSTNASYVSRDGYHQASSYLVETRAGLASDAWSYVIAPQEVVPRLSDTQLDWPGGEAIVGVGNISHIETLVRNVIDDSPSSAAFPS